jgi:L-ribulose-5-phosphate 3-epimerase
VTQHIGFMQGRLSPLIDGKIQAFPWNFWKEEFALAAGIGVDCMEWTLDHDRIFENPLMTAPGRALIAALRAAHGIEIPSLTGDFCMQAPFWKAIGRERLELVGIFEKVLLGCAAAGIGLLVVPLVDNGALDSVAGRELLERQLFAFQPLLREHGLRIAFESDLPPVALAAFIDGFPAELFGINYDIGNSASLGWNPAEEIACLGPRIINVHVKDRVLGGTTVALGTGAADLPQVFGLLCAARYGGNYILQTARAADGAHLETIDRYRQFVAGQIGGAHGA